MKEKCPDMVRHLGPLIKYPRSLSENGTRLAPKQQSHTNPWTKRGENYCIIQKAVSGDRLPLDRSHPFRNETMNQIRMKSTIGSFQKIHNFLNAFWSHILQTNEGLWYRVSEMFLKGSIISGIFSAFCSQLQTSLRLTDHNRLPNSPREHQEIFFSFFFRL